MNNRKNNHNSNSRKNSNCNLDIKEECKKDFLTGKEIADEIINNNGIRNSESETSISYDMTVEKVIKNVNKIMYSSIKKRIIKFLKIRYDGEYIQVCDSRTVIKPQEMFVVILKEYIKMPNNCYGIAYPRTRLCRKGIHVFNTGLIDPGYEGYLSTLAINFSKEPISIDVGDVYLRLMVHKSYKIYSGEDKISSEEKSPLLKEDEYNKYVNDRVAEAVAYPQTFLDIEEQIKIHSNTIADRITNKSTNRFILMLSVFALIFSLITIGIGYSQLSSFQTKFLNTSSVANMAENENVIQQIEILDEQINDIRINIDGLEKGDTQNSIELLERVIKLEYELDQIKEQNAKKSEE